MVVCYSYLYLYSRLSANQTSVLIGRKNKFAYWFDTDVENVRLGDRIMKLKLGSFKVYPREINGHFFAFYPEGDGCPLENGPGESCIIGGEIKVSFSSESDQERVRKNALEEFWEETGFRLDSIPFNQDHVYISPSEPYGIYFVEISMDNMQFLAEKIRDNFITLMISDIPRVKNMDLTFEPRVWSNEIANVEIKSIEEALTIFRSMNPNIAGWFVDGSVSPISDSNKDLYFM